MLCGYNCYHNKDKAPAGGQLWCFVPLVSPRTRVLFRLSKTERTTHTSEDLWNPPQLSTGSATLFREPQTSSDVYLEHTHEHDVEDERLQLWGSHIGLRYVRLSSVEGGAIV